MKKIRLLAAVLTLCLAITGCGAANSGGASSAASEMVASEAPRQPDNSTSASEVTGDESAASVPAVADTDTGFDLEDGTVTLNNGTQMPILGLGTFRLSQEEAENSVYHALLDGFRLIDTAAIYGNEEGVGRGIVRSGVPREEVFITTKLWTSDFANAESAIDEALERLGVEYIDLLLLHHTGDNDEDAYRAMEQAVEAGKVRSIGVSNFYQEDFELIMDMATITSAVVQNETHLYNQEPELKIYLAQYGTVLEAWFPFGGRGNTQTLFDDETVVEIVNAHGKTSAQVILRWHMQAGNIAIPGSSNSDHIQENFEIFDFALTDEEMERLNGLNRDERFSTY